MKTRSDREAELTAAILLLFRRAREQGDFGNFQFDLATAIAPALQAAFSDAAREIADEHDQAVQDGQLSSAALVFAQQRSATLAAQITRRSTLALSGALRHGLDEAELRGLLDDVFSDARAAAIGVTETTAAISAGDRFTAHGLVALGVLQRTALWRTEEDDRVCPICSPLDNTSEEIWQLYFPTGPPAHPHCRCRLRYQRVL